MLGQLAGAGLALGPSDARDCGTSAGWKAVSALQIRFPPAAALTRSSWHPQLAGPSKPCSRRAGSGVPGYCPAFRSHRPAAAFPSLFCPRRQRSSETRFQITLLPALPGVFAGQLCPAEIPGLGVGEAGEGLRLASLQRAFSASDPCLVLG